MADVQLDLGISGSNLLKEAQQLRSELAGVRDTSVATKKALQEAFMEGAKSVATFETELQASLKAQREQQIVIDALTKKMSELEKTQKASGDAAKKSTSDQIAETKKLALTIEELNAKIAARKDFLIKTDDVSKIAQYRAEIAVLEKQLEQALNIGKKGFDSMGKPVKEQQGLIQRLNALIEIYKKGIVSATNPELLSKYNKKLEETQREVQRLSNAGKTGFDQLGNKIDTTVKKTNLLSKSWGVLRQAAYLIPGLGLAGVISLISDGILALIKSLASGKGAIDDFKERWSLLTEAMKSSEYTDAIKNVNELGINIELAKKGFIDKEKVVKQYNETIGKTTGEVKNIDEAEKALAKNADSYIKMMLLKTAATITLQKAAKELSEAQIEYQEALNRSVQLNREGESDRDKAAGADGLSEFVSRGVKNEAEAAKRTAEQRVQKLNDIATKFQTDAAEIAKKFNFDFFGGQFDDKKTKEKSIKALQDYSDQIIALEKKLAEDRIKAMQDGRDKDIAVENKYYDDLIKQSTANINKYEREIEKTRTDQNKTLENKKKEIEQLKTLISLEYQLQEDGSKSHTARLLAIDLKYYQDSQKAFEDAQQRINDVLLNDEQKEIASLEKKYDQLIKTAKDAQKKLLAELQVTGSNPILQGELLAIDAEVNKLTESQLSERNAIIQKYNLRRLDEAQALAIAENDLIKVDGLKKEDLERLREQNKLKIVIDFARKKLAILEASGNEENQLQILQLKKLIQDSEAELDKLAASGKNKSLADYLFDFAKDAGLVKTQAEFNDIKSAFQSLASSLATIWTATIDARIADQQRLVDALTDQLDEQKDLVDQEKRLMEEGYANNYAIEEQKLADLKRRNEEENRELKKQQEEKAKAAKTLAIIQGSITAIQLAATAAGYFANSTQYGPIAGPLLALAAIATMFATFASAKQKGKEVSQYRYGGDIDLTESYTRHSDGGYDMIDKKSGKTVANVEGGEYGYVFRDGRKAKQFKPLFDAINNGSFERPRFTSGKLEETSNLIDQQATVVVINNVSGIEQLNSTMEKVEQNTRKGKEVEYRDGYRIEQTGNHIRKIKVA